VTSRSESEFQGSSPYGHHLGYLVFPLQHNSICTDRQRLYHIKALSSCNGLNVAHGSCRVCLHGFQVVCTKLLDPRLCDSGSPSIQRSARENMSSTASLTIRLCSSVPPFFCRIPALAKVHEVGGVRPWVCLSLAYYSLAYAHCNIKETCYITSYGAFNWNVGGSLEEFCLYWKSPTPGAT
jgi:hypothetical protein